MSLPVLVISQDLGHRNTLAEAIFSFGLRPVSCGTLPAAKALLARQEFAAVLCESLPDEDFQAVIMQLAGFAPIIIALRPEGKAFYLAATPPGVFDCIDFPPCPDELGRVLVAALGGSRNPRKIA
jgi:DNA-binding NtrC family response regulator